MARINRDGPEADSQPLPPEAEHIIVTDVKFGGTHEPDGFPEDETLLYERGDEVPFDKHREAVSELPTSLVALDADGNVVAGGERPNTPQLDKSVSVSSGLSEAIERWESGEGFDPSEYEDSD